MPIENDVMENKQEFDIQNKIAEVCMIMRDLLFKVIIEVDPNGHDSAKQLFCILSSFLGGMISEIVGEDILEKQAFLKVIVMQVTHAWEQLDIKNKSGVH